MAEYPKDFPKHHFESKLKELLIPDVQKAAKAAYMGGSFADPNKPIDHTSQKSDIDVVLVVDSPRDFPIKKTTMAPPEVEINGERRILDVQLRTDPPAGPKIELNI